MVEGHSCHRVAEAHKKTLLNKKFKAISPNKRFTDGAKAINQQPLSRIEVHGKNLFYFFGTPKEDGRVDTIVHIHFGMAAEFATHDASTAPDPTETTRLRLEHADSQLVAHLSAMTVRLIDSAVYKAKVDELGEDPLRSDANPEALFERVVKSKKSIGALLMDQGYFAGVGNIYRAEILFKAGVHPEIKGSAITRAQFNPIWQHSVLLLQRGFECGSILTVDPEEAEKLNKPQLRRYIYNQKHCGRCDGRVTAWSMHARTCYACVACQPVSSLSLELQKAAVNAGDVRVFESHCAPEPLEQRRLHPGKLKLAELRTELLQLGLDTKGSKATLRQRLSAAHARTQASSKDQSVLVKPGLAHIVSMASATAAAREKQLAGEGRHVEHVADEDTTQQGKMAVRTSLYQTPVMAREVTPPSRVRRAARKPCTTSPSSKRQLYTDTSKDSSDTGCPPLRRSKRQASTGAA
eukprot:m.148469 g.148469  ORF g.148469 m.148469 type:complete len:465 (-) comp16283_c0_seq3:126-1520(-)